MLINNNISAVIANKHLLRNETALSAATERLSSGYKINHAYDNPSGMAISNKMRAQIRALDRATDNTSDGISVIQTADGALNEVTSMIQRMRELAVQAANDTNTPQDRKQIQLEEAQLRDEIDRVSSSTEFNSMQLLNGDMQTKAYADGVTRLTVSGSVDPGTYQIKITQAATKAQIPAAAANGTRTAIPIPQGEVQPDQEGTFKINGQDVTLKAGMSADEAFEALRQAAELGDVTVSKDSVTTTVDAATSKPTATANSLTLTSGIKTDDYDEVLGNAWGKNSVIKIDADNDKAKAALGYFNLGAYIGETKGTDVALELTNTETGSFSPSATAAIDGKKVTITDNNGFEMSFLLDSAMQDKPVTDAAGTITKDSNGNVITKKANTNTSYAGVDLGNGLGNGIEIKVTDIGKMTFHVGANKDQTIDVDIPSVSAENLYLDQVNVDTFAGASRSISLLDDALTRISSIRADLGAAQNRLEHTYDSNNATNENVNDAVSRIRDTDMATEMVEYTKDNVLQQAGTSVLSQANELPQMALQLLQ